MMQTGHIDEKISMPPAPLTFKVASEDWEFQQIHRLNYETFVEEIPQHGGNAEKSLVDMFHSENTYFICLRDGRLLGPPAGTAEAPYQPMYRELSTLEEDFAELFRAGTPSADPRP